MNILRTIIMGIVIVLVLEKSFRLFKFLKKRIKPKFKKNKYQIFYETISTVLNLMERKKELAEAGVLVDLSFDAKTKEQITILALIRSGSLSFLGNDFKDLLLKIFDDDENKKDEIQHLCNYLENEQKKLMKLF